jgi:hypothetical protein
MMNGLEYVPCSTFENRTKFGHLEVEPDVRRHHPTALIFEEFVH